MSRVAIFGGSFDPPTICHVLTAFEFVNLNVCDEVWLVPCGPRLDKGLRASPIDRFNMISLTLSDLFGADSRIKIADFELDKDVSIPTALLMEKLRSENPENSFYFCIGSDLVKDLHNWRYADKLLREVQFLVIPRAGYGSMVDIPEEIRPLHYVELEDVAKKTGVVLPVSNHSSTMVRKRLALGMSCAGLITKSVEDYIKNNLKKEYNYPM